MLATLASGDSIATGGGQIVMRPGQFPDSDELDGSFYSPSGIRVGDEFFLYVMGAHWDGGPVPGYCQPGDMSPDCQPCGGDKLYVLKSPYTEEGVTSEFEFIRRISECSTIAGVKYF